ncbi:hypothetical protein COLO4_08480 [Corchorus olitorius]|uniref:Uncharacterized protein n=1 Tax=Corchorus olitorius TaxID=93759 RepID=A0A1R3KFK9_9ROSI|nr:hypothetical protein COLO4_08480 [Corchorus olitorius]
MKPKLGKSNPKALLDITNQQPNRGPNRSPQAQTNGTLIFTPKAQQSIVFSARDSSSNPSGSTKKLKVKPKSSNACPPPETPISCNSELHPSNNSSITQPLISPPATSPTSPPPSVADPTLSLIPPLDSNGDSKLQTDLATALCMDLTGDGASKADSPAGNSGFSGVENAIDPEPTPIVVGSDDDHPISMVGESGVDRWRVYVESIDTPLY